MTDIEFKDCMNNIGCPDLADKGQVGMDDFYRLKEQREYFAKNYPGFTESKTCKDLDKIINGIDRLRRIKVAVVNRDLESISDLLEK